MPTTATAPGATTGAAAATAARQVGTAIRWQRHPTPSRLVGQVTTPTGSAGSGVALTRSGGCGGNPTGCEGPSEKAREAAEVGTSWAQWGFGTRCFPFSLLFSLCLFLYPPLTLTSQGLRP